MSAFLLCSKTLLALILLAAGAAKLADLSSFQESVRLFVPASIGPRSIPAVTSAIAIVECITGVVSFSFPTASGIDLLVLALMATFAATTVWGYVFHRGASCRCFGRLSQRAFDGNAIVRSALLVGLALVVELAGPDVSRSRLALTPALHVALVMTGLMLVSVTFTAGRVLSLIAATRPNLLS